MAGRFDCNDDFDTPVLPLLLLLSALVLQVFQKAKSMIEQELSMSTCIEKFTLANAFTQRSVPIVTVIEVVMVALMHCWAYLDWVI